MRAFTPVMRGLVLATVLLGLCGCDRDSATSTTQDRTYTATRGDFRVSIKLAGQLEAVKVHELRFNIDRGGNNLVFTYVLPDRTPVQEGDVVFKISDEWFLTKQRELSTELQEQEQALAGHLQDLKELRDVSIADFKGAVTTLRNARDALQKYDAQEAPDRKQTLLTDINAKHTSLDAAIAAIFQAQLDLTSAYSSDSEAVARAKAELASKQVALTSAENELASAVDTLRNFRRYEHREKIEELREALTQALLGVKKEFSGIKVRFVKKRLAIETTQLRVDELRRELRDVTDALPQLVIKAPVAGTVFLDDDNWRYRDTGGLKAGARVDVGSTLATIPDMSQFRVSVHLPEDFKTFVQTNQTAYIRTKALPDLVLAGKVTSVASTATSRYRWEDNGDKGYSTTIISDTVDERLTPGMSVTVEIMIDDVKDVCFVPVEAVYNREGITCVKVVRGGEAFERVVETGRASLDYVELTKGLEPGEVVLLDMAQ